jgi:DNA-binding NarL/FixJ family response regulator
MAALDGTVLTLRQQQVLRLVSHGMANKEIALELHLSEPCIKKHVGVLMRRFAVPNRAAMVRRAIELHLLEVSD